MNRTLLGFAAAIGVSGVGAALAFHWSTDTDPLSSAPLKEEPGEQIATNCSPDSVAVRTDRNVAGGVVQILVPLDNTDGMDSKVFEARPVICVRADLFKEAEKAGEQELLIAYDPKGTTGSYRSYLEYTALFASELDDTPLPPHDMRFGRLAWSKAPKEKIDVEWHADFRRYLEGQVLNDGEGIGGDANHESPDDDAANLASERLMKACVYVSDVPGAIQPLGGVNLGELLSAIPKKTEKAWRPVEEGVVLHLSLDDSLTGEVKEIRFLLVADGLPLIAKSDCGPMVFHVGRGMGPDGEEVPYAASAQFFFNLYQSARAKAISLKQ